MSSRQFETPNDEGKKSLKTQRQLSNSKESSLSASSSSKKKKKKKTRSVEKFKMVELRLRGRKIYPCGFIATTSMATKIGRKEKLMILSTRGYRS